MHLEIEAICAMVIDGWVDATVRHYRIELVGMIAFLRRRGCGVSRMFSGRSRCVHAAPARYRPRAAIPGPYRGDYPSLLPLAADGGRLVTCPARTSQCPRMAKLRCRKTHSQRERSRRSSTAFPGYGDGSAELLHTRAAVWVWLAARRMRCLGCR